MNEIIYAAPWSKDRINSWSGTIFYLRNSMLKYNIIHDIDTEIFSSKNPSVLAYRAITKMQKKLKIYKRDMSMSRIKLMDKHIKVTIGNAPILQFEECPGIRNNTKQFIYQDLSVSFVEYLYANDRKLFDISGFQENDISIIHKRNDLQKAFYNEATGIFTMSHWLYNLLCGGGVSG